MIKRTSIIFFAFLICQTAFSQITETVEKKPVNEIKFNFIPILREFFPEINYEHINSKKIGLGLAAGVSLKDYDVHNFQEKFRIMPYIRPYFGANSDFSFFFEANFIISGIKKMDFYVQNEIGTYIPRNTVYSGFGFAYGAKYQISNKFFVEVFLGCGFYFNEYVYPRVGVSVGKQF